MDLIKVMERFPDQESCIAHLEKMHWKVNRNVRTVKAPMWVGAQKRKKGVSGVGIATIAMLLFFRKTAAHHGIANGDGTFFTHLCAHRTVPPR